MHCDLRRLKQLLLAKYAGLMLDAFEQRRHALSIRLRKARKKPSEKAVHDMRVALRRMLSMLTVVETAISPSRTRKVRRTLKKQLRNLGDLRDVQTHIALTDELLADFPQLTAFRKFLIGQERRMGRKIARELKRFRPREVRKATDSLLARLVRSLDPEADRILGGRITAAIEDAYRRVLSLRFRIDPSETESIHRTRIAFKRFRYMAEITSPCFPRLNPDRLGAMHAYQDRMGAIHDLDTLLEAMMAFRRTSGLTSILVVENEIRRRRQRLIDEFMTTVDELRFFWSTAPAESREVV